jgi:outer membrane lipopolysaccharide assembly protein LptE/RlpB
MLFLKRNNIWIISLFLVLFPSCGYKFVGSGSFPAGVESVCISILENRTSETGMENVLTNDLIYEVTRGSKVALTSRDKADALLSGVIKSMSIQTISRTGTHSSLERRVRVAVDLKLTSPDGRVIWSARGVSANEAYDVAPDKLVTEQHRRDAISVLSKRLAETVYNRIIADF